MEWKTYFTNELESELLLNSILTLTLSCFGKIYAPSRPSTLNKPLACHKAGGDSCPRLRREPNHLERKPFTGHSLIYSLAPRIVKPKYSLILGASYLSFPFIRATKMLRIGHHLEAISNLFPFAILSCTVVSPI